MNIIERGTAFVKGLHDLATRSVWDWRRCPRCGKTDTCCYGAYHTRPWFFGGRQQMRIQRHRCHRCQSTYSEQSPLHIRGSWYAREVHRAAIDYWQFGGTSLRRGVALLRAHINHDGRWLLWRPLDPAPAAADCCRLGASTAQRWLDGAGARAAQTVAQQVAGVPTSGQMATDGLWARLRGGGKRVVLALVDRVSGVIWPPVVVSGEEAVAPWAALFERAAHAGLVRDTLRGLVSDGAPGLMGYLSSGLVWVNHQRCVWHVWRKLAGELARSVSAAAAGLAGDAAQSARVQVRRELVALVHGVMDAPSDAAAAAALQALAAHRLGQEVAVRLRRDMERLLVHRLPYNAGLGRVGPEWIWRDFRLRLSHGRNHGSDVRLERAVLVWAIYRNFMPAQGRCERKRRYRHPGRSPLEVAGAVVGTISYLDALEV